MRNKRDYSDKKLNEVSLKKGGKSLLRKISINNLKNYSKTPKDNNQKKLFNEGIIERFYKKEKKNNNNKSYYNNKTNEINRMKRNHSNNNFVSNHNNSFNNNSYSSLKYNKSFVGYSNHNTLYSQNNNNFINYFTFKNKSKIHNYQPEEIVTVYNKINKNEKKVKYLIPIYDKNNKYIGFYKDLNFNQSNNQDLNIEVIKNTTKSSNEIDKLNYEIVKLKQQQNLDKQEIDNKLKFEIRDLKQSLKKEILKIRDNNDLNYLNPNELSENHFEDSSFFEDEYKLYKNYNNINNLKIPNKKPLPKIISKNNNKKYLFRNSFNNDIKKNQNIILSHSQSLGNIPNYKNKLNRNNFFDDFNHKNQYNLPNIRFYSPSNDNNINENSQLSKSNHAKKFRRFKLNKFIRDN